LEQVTRSDGTPTNLPKETVTSCNSTGNKVAVSVCGLMPRELARSIELASDAYIQLRGELLGQNRETPTAAEDLARGPTD